MPGFVCLWKDTIIRLGGLSIFYKGVRAQGAKGKGVKKKKDIKVSKVGLGGKIRGARLFKSRRGCSPQRLQGEILGHLVGGIFTEQQSPLLTRKHNCQPTFSTFSGRCDTLNQPSAEFRGKCFISPKSQLVPCTLSPKVPTSTSCKSLHCLVF